MAIVFNADEVLAMAEQIERNGAAFYRLAATKNAKAAQLLLRIAEEELQHLVTFQAMRRALPEQAKESTAYDPLGEAALYLTALADRRIFNVDESPEAVLGGKKTLGEILIAAIGKEKDSIVFYTGMKAMVPAGLGKDKLDAIIAEELSHIGWLTNAFDELCPAVRPAKKK